MPEKKPKKLTVLFIPDDKSRPFSLKVSPAFFKAGIFFLVIFFLGFCALLFRAGNIGVKLQMLNGLMEENAKLKNQNRQLLEIANKVKNIETLSEYVRRIAETAKENNAGTVTPEQSVAAADGLLSRDSMDDLLESMRTAETRYEDLAEYDVTPELLMQSIPNIQPVDGWITQPFRVKRDSVNKRHAGLDFAAPIGSLIKATAPGTVDDAVDDAYFGRCVTIKHNYGYKTRYCHCNQIVVSKGDAVERGQTIALVGNTGVSSGPHLHYEVIRNGTHVDPIKYIVNTTGN